MKLFIRFIIRLIIYVIALIAFVAVMLYLEITYVPPITMRADRNVVVIEDICFLKQGMIKTDNITKWCMSHGANNVHVMGTSY